MAARTLFRQVLAAFYRNLVRRVQINTYFIDGILPYTVLHLKQLIYMVFHMGSRLTEKHDIHLIFPAILFLSHYYFHPTDETRNLL